MRLKHIKKVLSEEEIENFERYRDKISCRLLRWEQERFEKKVIEDTKNFWTCE